ncbi:arginyltransferase [Haematospirillum sp. H1815]|uniref:arginyltransferase n=1 Tax=Haematospirillum sp. H1815 TaxID=2723108 RepID=UPI00143B12C5|nr:arginyltransferase [Haematospirillum sp. H1815]NKD76381.1 arginyltransferase [Haematospirillum sp. H1815]
MENSPVRRPHFFFTTAPMPCPYMEGRMERKIVTELAGPDAGALHDTLSRSGFRRSHSIAYAPACPSCTACTPVRVVVRDFARNRSFRRTWNSNADLYGRMVPPRATAEQYRLFSAYQACRHSGSDMALMSFYDYRAMVEDSPIETHLVEFRDHQGKLTAVCLMDKMDDGVSGVYSFFDTSRSRRGLGTFIILWMIETARTLELPYVYLGYWIAESPKMSYKKRFTPLEVFTGNGWHLLDEKTGAPRPPVLQPFSP